MCDPAAVSKVDVFWQIAVVPGAAAGNDGRGPGCVDHTPTHTSSFNHD